MGRVGGHVHGHRGGHRSARGHAQRDVAGRRPVGRRRGSGRTGGRRRASGGCCTGRCRAGGTCAAGMGCGGRGVPGAAAVLRGAEGSTRSGTVYHRAPGRPDRGVLRRDVPHGRAHHDLPRRPVPDADRLRAAATSRRRWPGHDPAGGLFALVEDDVEADLEHEPVVPHRPSSKGAPRDLGRPQVRVAGRWRGREDLEGESPRPAAVSGAESRCRHVRVRPAMMSARGHGAQGGGASPLRSGEFSGEPRTGGSSAPPPTCRRRGSGWRMPVAARCLSGTAHRLLSGVCGLAPTAAGIVRLRQPHLADLVGHRGPVSAAGRGQGGLRCRVRDDPGVRTAWT